MQAPNKSYNEYKNKNVINNKINNITTGTSIDVKNIINNKYMK